MKNLRLISLIIVIFLFSNVFISFSVESKQGFSGLWCKDIIACGDATKGDYNLLLKVRDPSRPGLQVLCIVPEGYEYLYHKPWTGKSLNFKVLHKYIGVASKGDTIPNIVKAGMTLSDAGIAYGDADTSSSWINPTRHAWDDFDWIRYTCEKANSEDIAVDLLTKEVVKKMHATSVAENLFVVGPKKGYIIEADAYRYKVKEVNNGVVVMSNYPKELWKTQIRKTLPISLSFDTVVEKYVRNKQTVRLKSIYAIKIDKIGEDYIKVKPSFFHALKSKNLGVTTKINISERKTVGFFSVELLDIVGNKAKIRVCNKFKAWEEKMLEHIEPRYGSITIKDMFNWSRLHKEDLDGLRPMCEDFFKYEAVAIYKIPKENYKILSMGWFSPNHACSSIYVPFHICNTDIYSPYESGESAQLSLDLLNEYGHGNLVDVYSNTEDIFLGELEVIEENIISNSYNDDLISDFLTIFDMSLQKQAFLTEEIWIQASRIINQNTKKEIIEIISEIWDTNYTYSLNKMKQALLDLEKITRSNEIIENIQKIALDICKSKVDILKLIGKEVQGFEKKYYNAEKLIENGEYGESFKILQDLYSKSDMLIKGQSIIELEKIEKSQNDGEDYILIWFFIIILLVAFAIIALPIKLILK
ncbi:hypothetical protein AYK20_06365 [Thermoplasmatales archaeon SG8-52-1]|nr:MAG: hypothetical protein AYK20_06365 [Thermoplasmatales archaeon SG8-52-1]